jgi:hypothetical protein
MAPQEEPMGATWVYAGAIPPVQRALERTGDRPALAPD